MHTSLSQMDPASRSRAVRLCSRRIFDLAQSGSPRQEFICGVLDSVYELIGCLVTRAVLIDHHDRRFYAVAGSGGQSRARCQVMRDKAAGCGRVAWSIDTDDLFEQLCRQVVNEQVDGGLPWFTDDGYLWIDDLDRFPHCLTRSDSDGNHPGLAVTHGVRSLMVLPVEGARHRFGLLQLESDTAGFFLPEHFSSYGRLAQALGLALDARSLHIALRERVKELSCLYGIARLFAREDWSTEEVLENAVAMLSTGWLYPEATAARIVLDDRMFDHNAANAMIQSMQAPIVVGGRQRGYIEVGYTTEKPPIDEGPFMIEERRLIDTVAQELAFVVEQKSTGMERRCLQEQLRHADRLATIGQLAAGVAHELNEPLSTIVGFAQLAARNEQLPEDANRDLQKIVTAALHARKVIRELLVFSREATPVMVSCNLNELIRDGLFFLESRFEKAGITLVCDLDPQLPMISADRSNMLQILTNLVVNAVQAMPKGGQLTIETRTDASTIALVITDTGIGMDDQTVQRIFHPFFTTKEVDEGTGLGLSVVHGIVVSHNGTIEVASEPGEGARFTIQLPRYDVLQPEERFHDASRQR